MLIFSDLFKLSEIKYKRKLKTFFQDSLINDNFSKFCKPKIMRNSIFYIEKNITDDTSLEQVHVIAKIFVL